MALYLKWPRRDEVQLAEACPAVTHQVVHSGHFEKWNESVLKGPFWLDKNAYAPPWVTNQIIFNNNQSAELMFTWSPTGDEERNEAWSTVGSDDGTCLSTKFPALRVMKFIILIITIFSVVWSIPRNRKEDFKRNTSFLHFLPPNYLPWESHENNNFLSSYPTDAKWVLWRDSVSYCYFITKTFLYISILCKHQMPPPSPFPFPTHY